MTPSGGVDDPREEALVISAETIDAWLLDDKERFASGDRSAWVSAMILSRLAERAPPSWVTTFVLDTVVAWQLNDADLAEMLGLERSGRAHSRRIKQHQGAVYAVALRLLKKRPSRQRSPAFWQLVAETVSRESDNCPPFGWEKARKMFSEFEKAKMRMVARANGDSDSSSSGTK